MMMMLISKPSGGDLLKSKSWKARRKGFKLYGTLFMCPSRVQLSCCVNSGCWFASRIRRVLLQYNTVAFNGLACSCRFSLSFPSSRSSSSSKTGRGTLEIAHRQGYKRALSKETGQVHLRKQLCPWVDPRKPHFRATASSSIRCVGREALTERTASLMPIQ